MKVLEQFVKTAADSTHYLFVTDDFQAILPEIDIQHLRVLLGRAVKAGVLERVCKGVYLWPYSGYNPSLVVYHTAAILRSVSFSYLSLESVLSEAGLLSQVPIHWITLMTSGRSAKIVCEGRGVIEFIHTNRRPDNVFAHLHWDATRSLFVADTALALSDMRRTHRPTDLLHEGLENEFV